MGKKLDGKIALITGASRGIGAETARVLRDHGAYVILIDILDEEGSELARFINGMYLHLDVGEADSWSQVYDDIKSKFGKLDVLFNNAGITGFDSDYGSLDPEYSTL